MQQLYLYVRKREKEGKRGEKKGKERERERKSEKERKREVLHRGTITNTLSMVRHVDDEFRSVRGCAAVP